MKLDRALTRRLAGFAVLAFVLGMLWWLDQRRAKDVELLYDLSRIGRTDLAHLRVEVRQGPMLARETEFFYAAREGSAPTHQAHRTKLAPGQYTVRFHMRFAKGTTVVREGALALPAAEPVNVPVPSAL